jgi:translation initiation factor IF-2
LSSLSKYRVHEVAKDFGLSSKDITKILTDYATTPKNHMQVLTNDELNIIFEYLTQNNQTDIEAFFEKAANTAKSAAGSTAAAAEPVPVGEASAGAADGGQVNPAPTSAGSAKAGAAPNPAVQTAPKGKPADTAASKLPPHQPLPSSVSENRTGAASGAVSKEVSGTASKEVSGVTSSEEFKPKREVRIIDTRGSSVDLSKYDDKVDRLVPEGASKMGSGKEKIKRTADTRRPNFPGQKRRYNDEHEKMRKLEQAERQKKIQLKVSIPDEISVAELASRLKKTGADVVRTLMKLGTMASLSQIIDFETASLVALEYNAKIEREVHVTIEERLFDEAADSAENLLPRSPVVVVMGHVDHGKTSLLDKIRKADVVSGEAGGITQHIGAYTVNYAGSTITFLDTPGHAAFTSMRMRGANVTDIAILVVAADDGIMPQTIEAINHAKAAKVPIIVAVNKMDKPDANPDKVMQQLTEYELIPEEWGGDTVVCKVSAATGEGIDNLLEMLLLTAEVSDLRANPNRRAQGAVIEARLDKGRGPIATLLVQNGTLNHGDIIIAGKTVGRVRAMTDYNGRRIDTAGPSTPVEVIGLSEVPEAGDTFGAVEDERMARELVEQRKFKGREDQVKSSSKVTLDDLFAQIKEGEIHDLNIILKADVHGSAEALKTSLEKIKSDEVRVRVIHSGVGAINESDILLASTANAIVVGFNVRPDAGAAESAKRAGVDLRMYRIIYECIDEVEAAMKGMLSPKFKEEQLGQAEVRQVFRASNIGTVAGSYVISGKILRGAGIRLVRDGIVIHEGAISSLKRFKDDAREVSTNYECGISIENFTDIKEGDIIEAFQMVEVKRD